MDNNTFLLHQQLEEMEDDEMDGQQRLAGIRRFGGTGA
jgi:hypothetical protein